MEKTVAEDLGEEQLDTALGQLLHVGALIGEGRQIGHLHTVNALHDQHLRPAPVPIDLRHVQHGRAFEVAAQLAGVGRFAQQVEFVVNGFFVIGDHVHRVQQSRVSGYPLGDLRQNEQPRKVRTDDRLQARPHHFDYHFFACFQTRGVDLSDRSRSQRGDVEAAEDFADFRAQLRFDQRDGFGGVERRHAVLQHHQLVGDVFRQQIASGRQQLPKLDENRP